MRDCTCCGRQITSDDVMYATVVLFPSGAIYRLCTGCMDALWAARNPGMQQRDEQGQLPLEEG
jgi:hypothetical protein